MLRPIVPSLHTSSVFLGGALKEETTAPMCSTAGAPKNHDEARKCGRLMRLAKEPILALPRLSGIFLVSQPTAAR
jgi:hypothetical protein